MYHPFPDDRAKAIGLARKYISCDPLFLDTETTGLADDDEICEIAVIDVKGEVWINSLVKPTKPISENTSRIHGITNELVANAPTILDLLPRLDQVLRHREVLVYNVDFDRSKIAQSIIANDPLYSWVPWWWANVNSSRSQPIYWHCAMNLYSMYYGDWNDYHQSYRWQRLTNAVLQCGIEMPLGIHRALNDAELTRQVVLHMAENKNIQMTLPETGE